MKTYTLADIRALSPCYDPADKVSEDWTGTVADILRLENVEAKDRFWVATRLLDDRTNRLFAVWCAREALKLVETPDPRSVAACDVAERFAFGKATKKQLAVAYASADAAAYAYAAAAAASAAYAASAAAAAYADSASASAAYAANAAAANAAKAAHYAATTAAAAANAAAANAASAAYADVRKRERQWQVRELIKLIEEHER